LRDGIEIFRLSCVFRRMPLRRFRLTYVYEDESSERKNYVKELMSIGRFLKALLGGSPRNRLSQSRIAFLLSLASLHFAPFAM